MLMNVGPTADGRIVPVFEERLIQIGMLRQSEQLTIVTMLLQVNGSR